MSVRKEADWLESLEVEQVLGEAFKGLLRCARLAVCWARSNREGLSLPAPSCVIPRPAPKSWSEKS